MSNKSLLKYGVAIALLAVILIFLGVNYVPRVYASSSIQSNVVAAGKQTRIDYIEHFPPVIEIPRSYVGSDKFEQHPSVVITTNNYYASPNWIELHPSAVINFAGSDWIQRHP